MGPSEARLANVSCAECVEPRAELCRWHCVIDGHDGWMHRVDRQVLEREIRTPAWLRTATIRGVPPHVAHSIQCRPPTTPAVELPCSGICLVAPRQAVEMEDKAHMTPGTRADFESADVAKRRTRANPAGTTSREPQKPRSSSYHGRHQLDTLGSRIGSGAARWQRPICAHGCHGIRGSAAVVTGVVGRREHARRRPRV